MLLALFSKRMHFNNFRDFIDSQGYLWQYFCSHIIKQAPHSGRGYIAQYLLAESLIVDANSAKLNPVKAKSFYYEHKDLGAFFHQARLKFWRGNASVVEEDVFKRVVLRCFLCRLTEARFGNGWPHTWTGGSEQHLDWPLSSENIMLVVDISSILQRWVREAATNLTFYFWSFLV